jgi:hypothetical protein
MSPTLGTGIVKVGSRSCSAWEKSCSKRVYAKRGDNNIETELRDGDVRGMQIWGRLVLYMRHGRHGGDEVSVEGPPRTDVGMNPKPCDR